MYDSFNRKINYLRISVTDRCNLRCVYCMPPDGVKALNHNDILTYKEITSVVSIAVRKGVDKVRITGGEPLVRKGIVSLVEMIAAIEGIKDLGLTTNAILLDKYALDLKNAGLHRVNISLDTLNPERFKQITRLGNITDTLRGIDAAEKADLLPIKLNCVIKKSKDEPDALLVSEFAKKRGFQIRYIREMDLEHGQFWQVKGGDGGHCATCNRLRLTANGDIKPCLFSDNGYNIRELGIEKALEFAVTNKPLAGTVNKVNYFSNIGG